MQSNNIGINLNNSISKRKEKIAQYLEKKRGSQINRKRSLSNHVISRWYRPPEIIFIEKDYDQSTDLWSTGCILSDILNCCQIQLDQNGIQDVR
jgi:serine/threonine protein kinase